MRAVIQRVSSAKVEIEGAVKGSVNEGLLVFIGIEDADNQVDVEWISSKIVQLRVFSDEGGLMNKSILEIGGNILLISQFTLFGQTKKGNRPSFIKAARPDVAIPIYEKLQEILNKKLGKRIETGIFGADMAVSLTNDGPVTLYLDTKNKE
jgi:D-tyrosyl-tRNA(Tyr) deacylase